ncbi:MAG: Regulatory protein RepA [Planctomycetes bacterium ADurb.Bin126]|nr:MAG: Regulatory protein RepA [Planctomycetes bacterium ADurb.Bin126]HOD83926.1 AAA family ATPase [Phycisphaerae bacterium]HQL76225.1 AAA family ATPase [Phycisphaerae bacterium]
MVALTTDVWSRQYEDSYELPDSPERLEAEQVYRIAFLDAARMAARWREPDREMLEAAWNQRRAVRRAAEIESGGVIYYRPGHAVAAARARGKVQAFEHAAQAWDELTGRGMSDEAVAAVALPAWLHRIKQWAAEEIDPARIRIPQWMSHMFDDKQIIEATRDYPHRDAPEPPIGAATPAMRTVREILCMYTDLRRPVIQGLLREGEVMNIIAPPKTGKSWLATDLALTVATGGTWLNAFGTAQGDVLIIDNELHPETTAHRIPMVAEARRLDLDAFCDRVCVDNLRGRLQDLLAMEAYFAAIQPGRFKLIVLDAFYRFVPKGADENDNATIAMLYNHLDRHAARLGCSFVLIHHASKGNQSGKAITDVGAGAGSQSRATDTHLVLRAHEEDGVVVLDAAVRSWKPIEPMCLRWDFPVFNPAPDLDPAALRPERPRRRKENKGRDGGDAKPPWTARRFAEAFFSTEPAGKASVVALAVQAGLSQRQANTLLSAAEAQSLIRRQEVEGDRRRACYIRAE